MDVNLIVGKVLLSKICPTSPESDQTEGGWVGRVYTEGTPENTEVRCPRAESERFDLTKIQLSSKLSPKQC